MEGLRRHFQSVEQTQATQYRTDAESVDSSQPPRPEKQAYSFLVLDPLHWKVTYLHASVFLICKMERSLSTSQGDAEDEMSLTCHTHSAIYPCCYYSHFQIQQIEDYHSL